MNTYNTYTIVDTLSPNLGTLKEPAAPVACGGYLDKGSNYIELI